MSDWEVVGKGGANVVLCHKGQNTLLRIPQLNKDAQETTLLDRFIWGDNCKLPLTRDTSLVEDTGRFISFWGHVALSEETSAAISETCTAFQGAEAESIHPDNRIKWRVSQYQLHQQLKLQQGKIARVSGYDPLDLFADDPATQMQALESLVSDPQNNLSLWMASDAVDKRNLSSWVADEQPGMTRILQGVLNHTGVLKSLLAMQRLDAWDIEGIYPLCSHASFHLQQHRLDMCLQQSMCEKPGKCHWMKQWCSERTCSEKNQSEYDKHCDTLRALHGLSWAQVQAVLRKYCLAVAAKDCSIILSYTAEKQEPATDAMQTSVMDCYACKNDADKLRNLLHHPKHEVGTCHGVGPTHTCIGSMCIDQKLIQYRLGVVDMDRKSIGKVAYRLKLDQATLGAWNRRH